MLVTGNILISRVWCHTADQAAVNVRYWRVDSHTGNGGNLAQLAALLNAALDDDYKGLLSVGATYRGVQVQRVWPTPPTVAESNVTTAGVGLVAGDMQPKQVSGLITFTTGLAGRKYRGRLYVPFPGEASNAVLGVPVAAYVTGLTNLGSLYTASYSPGAGADTSFVQPIIPTRVLRAGTGGTTGKPPIYDLNGGYNRVIASFARPFWATQRRRGDYGRKNVVPI